MVLPPEALKAEVRKQYRTRLYIWFDIELWMLVEVGTGKAPTYRVDSPKNVQFFDTLEEASQYFQEVQT